MKVNWKVRIANPTFCRSLIAAVGTVVVAVAALWGVDASGAVEGWVSGLGAVVVAVFGVLNVLGVVADPTTDGLCDSERAMGYEAPAESLATKRGEEDDGD